MHNIQIHTIELFVKASPQSQLHTYIIHNIIQHYSWGIISGAFSGHLHGHSVFTGHSGVDRAFWGYLFKNFVSHRHQFRLVTLVAKLALPRKANVWKPWHLKNVEAKVLFWELELSFWAKGMSFFSVKWLLAICCGSEANSEYDMWARFLRKAFLDWAKCKSCTKMLQKWETQGLRLNVFLVLFQLRQMLLNCLKSWSVVF